MSLRSISVLDVSLRPSDGDRSERPVDSVARLRGSGSYVAEEPPLAAINRDVVSDSEESRAEQATIAHTAAESIGSISREEAGGTDRSIACGFWFDHASCSLMMS